MSITSVNPTYSTTDWSQFYNQIETQAVNSYAQTEKQAEQEEKQTNDEQNAENLQG